MRLLVCLVLVSSLALPGCSSQPGPVPSTPSQHVAATPFTAEQIRDANPPGTRLLLRIQRPGQPPALREMRFVQSDRDRTVITSRMFREGGQPLSDPERRDATWIELRDHAAFPADRTRRTRAVCKVPAGRFDTWMYSVEIDNDGRPATSRYHFADDRPGPPVLYETEQDGEIVFLMVLLEDSRG